MNVTQNRQFDFIIVGGGSAGCVLANRLSSEKAHVLVIEAGRVDHAWNPFIHMPAALTIPIGNKYYDWCYHSEPEPHLNQRRVFHARGKVLGGSSSINGMIFQRGNPMDYEKWAQIPGLENWSYSHCLPYFKRMEDALGGSEPYRGKSGPLHLERGPVQNPLFHAFLQAAREAGYPATADVNAYQQEGFSAFDRNIKNGRRWSAARAYFHPVKNRPNLHLKTGLQISKILFEGTRAIGVETFDRRGQTERFYSKEVVLCAGAIGSPQILQLSGIGNAEELGRLGIQPVHDLPGVGENLQDHLEVYVQHFCKEKVSLNPALKWWRKPDIGARWLFFRNGPGASNHFEAGGFIRSNDSYDYPNLMIHFLPLAVRYNGARPIDGHGYQLHIGPMYSNSKGSVKIRSKVPTEYPKLVFNYLSTKEDRREWVEAIRAARNILRQKALSEYDGGERSPGPGVESDEEILEWVRRESETALHPSCTCKMGQDAMSVVDPDQMRVHGIEGLRVVDASAMPVITNGNIYAPVVMIAEKASDRIMGRSALQPLHLPYFQHSKKPRSPDEGLAPGKTHHQPAH